MPECPILFFYERLNLTDGLAFKSGETAGGGFIPNQKANGKIFCSLFLLFLNCKIDLRGLNRAVIVAMPAMMMVQKTVNQIINVVAVRHGFVVAIAV